MTSPPDRPAPQVTAPDVTAPDVTAPDVTAMTGMLQAAAPLNRTLGISVESVSPDPAGATAVLRLPNLEGSRNHVGGPHAGAIFTLGETSAATLMTLRFGHWLDRMVPLAVTGTIRWTRLALGDVLAEARMGRPAADIEAELEAGERPEWTTHVTFRRAEDGQECGQMDVVLTLRPRRSDPGPAAT